MNYTKIEIIVSDIYLERVVALLEKAGVTGYTAISISRGKGIKQGEQLSDGLLPTTHRSLLFSVTTEEITNLIIKESSAYLEKIGAVLIASPISYASGLK
jgi:nitrogen regulatory protein PII